MDTRVMEILDILEDSPPATTAIAEAARRLSLSAGRTSRLFKAQTGMTMGQCHKELRLKPAKKLLHDNSLTLKQISALLGYSDVTHFIRWFRRALEVTPGTFRAALHEGLDHVLVDQSRPSATTSERLA